MDSRLTLTNTGYPAPTWYQRFDEPTRYWKFEAVAEMEAVSRTPSTVPVADVRDAVTAEALYKQRTFGHATEMYSGICTECGSPFQSTSPRTVTCQNIVCKQQRDKLVQDERRGQERAAKLTTVTCMNPGCGNQFTTHDQRVKTCSAECAKARGRYLRRKEARVAA